MVMTHGSLSATQCNEDMAVVSSWGGYCPQWHGISDVRAHCALALSRSTVAFWTWRRSDGQKGLSFHHSDYYFSESTAHWYYSTIFYPCASYLPDLISPHFVNIFWLGSFTFTSVDFQPTGAKLIGFRRLREVIPKEIPPEATWYDYWNCTSL